jgi:hypothetical protein
MTDSDAAVHSYLAVGKLKEAFSSCPVGDQIPEEVVNKEPFDTTKFIDFDSLDEVAVY